MPESAKSVGQPAVRSGTASRARSAAVSASRRSRNDRYQAIRLPVW